MRALILVTILGFAGFASAAISLAACTSGGATTANAALCTDAALTVNGVSLAAQNPVACAANYYVQANAGKTATSCVAISNGCATNAPNIAGSPTVPVVNTCQNGNPTSTDTTQALIAPAATTAACNNPTGAAATPTATYYSAGSIATAAGAPFSATPINTWQCYTCQTGCTDCSPAATKTFNSGTAAQAGCKTAATGYYVNGGLTADATSGLYAVAACPTAVNATYGNNATAASCTACNPVVGGAQTYGNCTVATCGTGYTYVSIANTTNLGNQTIGGKSVNLSAVPYANSGPYIGCYNSDNLLALITAAQAAAANNTNTTSSASRITAGIAVASAVAAVFAF